MKARILVAVVCVPLLFCALFFLPPIATGIVTGLISAIASVELISAARAAANRRIPLYALLAAAAIPIAACLGREADTGPFILLLLLFALFIEAILAHKTERAVSFAQITITLFAGGLLPFFLSALPYLRLMENGHLLVLLPVIVAFLSDAGAYFIGLRFGKRRLMPNVSPNKTVAGSLGGLAASVLALLLYGLVILLATDLTVNFWLAALYGLLGSLVTQLGDLAFSFIKREYTVKDFGNLLPGHGGMLDRFDSMVFAAPLLLTLVTWGPMIY